MQHIIQQLAEIGKLKNFCHEQGDDVPMPSIEALGEVVRIARALLFPGYFGDAVINEQTLLYHIGIHVERLQGLLIRQIKSGLCFDGTLPCNDDLESTARRKAAAFIEGEKVSVNGQICTSVSRNVKEGEVLSRARVCETDGFGMQVKAVGRFSIEVVAHDGGV